MPATHPLLTKRAVHRTYYAAVFLRWFAVALPMALLVLLMTARGLSLLDVGLTMGLHAAMVAILELPTGGLADAIGRKRTALLAQFVNLLATVAFLLASSFAAFAVAAALLGTARALASGALDAWFVDALLAADAEHDLQPSLAHAGTLTILGLSLGSLVGGAIPGWLGGGLPADGTALLTPLALPFLASFALQIATMLVIAQCVREVRPHDPEADPAAPVGLRAVGPILAGALRSVRDNRVVALIMATTAASGVAIAALETFWQPRFATLLGQPGGDGAPTSVFGLLMAGAFGVGVLGNLVSIPASRWLGRRYGLVAALGQALSGLAVLALAAATGAPLAVAGFWAAYLFQAVPGSPIGTILAAEIPSSRRSATMSVVSLASFVGALAGSVGFGVLAEAAGIPVVWAVAGSILVVSSGAMLAVDRLRRAGAAAPTPA